MFSRYGARYAITGAGRNVGSGAGTPQAAIYSSGSSIAEDQDVGTVVGTLGVSNATGTPSFTLVDDADGYFALSGNDIVIASSLDYETASTQILEVSVSDTTPAIANTFLTIFITDVADTGPTITSSDTVTQDENGELSHYLTANEAVTWSISGGVDAARFAISGNVKLTWAANGTQDYETPLDDNADNIYAVIVRATNGGGFFSDQAIVVTVVDVLENVLSNISAPVLSGTATVGQTLSCTTGSWSGEAPITYAYQWYRNDVAVLAATFATYPLTSADGGAVVHCRVTATNPLGSAFADSNVTDPVISVDVTAPTITSANTADNPENSLLAHELTANESVTWSLIGGADMAAFEITDSTLGWASGLTRDYEAPVDADADNAYVVQVRATDASSNTSDQTITVTVTDVDETAPTITSSATASIIENVQLAHTLTANETVTWSIVGGFDLSMFEISGSTLRWSDDSTKDYEAPLDHNTDNLYLVTVRATDLLGNFADQAITITVTNDVADDVPGTAGTPAGLLLAVTKAA